jgi:3-dehydroquinate synthase II
VSRERVAIRPRREDTAGRRAIRDRARQRGFRSFVLLPAEETDAHPDERVLVQEGDRLRPPSGEEVAIHHVDSTEALSALLGRTPDGGTLAIEWTLDRVIPLENAVAARGRRFHLWTVARTPEEVPGALGALEHGADLVIVDVHEPAEVDRLEHLIEGLLPSTLEWDRLTLGSVGPVGVGDRVLVDTTSLLAPEEGMLVGSAAAFLFHVASEAEGSGFSRPRPFRVNAGAAHSYVLMTDGTTRYLSELDAGDSVLVATPDGTARSVRVGRVKIERRPLVLVSALDHGAARTLFAQEAETVRLTTARGRISTTELRAGDEVLGVRLPPARHLGRAVDETIEER